ncbi:MAG: helix-turn-helix domain-containing protein [Alphaproteobacteria bacterium]
MSNTFPAQQGLPAWQQEPSTSSNDTNVIPIPKRSRRGRKARRASSHPLRDIRHARGMTLEELSDLSSLSPSYLSRLESGTRRLNVDTITRLSRALNCDPRDLLTDGDQWNMPQLSGAAAMPPQAMQPAAIPQIGQLPLYGAVQLGGNVDFKNPLSTIPCPQELQGVPGAFAYIINDDYMVPRYRPGDRLLVHPGRPLVPPATAVIITNDHQAIVGEFVGWREESDEPGADQCLELKRYRDDSGEVGSYGKVLIPTRNIFSMGRVVGCVEA